MMERLKAAHLVSLSFPLSFFFFAFLTPDLDLTHSWIQKNTHSPLLR